MMHHGPHPYGNDISFPYGWGDGDLLRIADETMGGIGSEGGYLYPANFFEPVQPDELPALMPDRK